MFGFGNKKLPTGSYKGVRDFYPEDQAIQNYIFGIMRKTSLLWGYEEYSASILEPLEIYRSKTSEEIVEGQIYSFKDRGGREVALRPEMTPTVARMIAGKIQELPSPIRWYSIPNVFRYEKPQKGRLREHWQLNVDIFGVLNPFADAEVIALASDIMHRFGAKDSDFVVKLNSRFLLDELFEKIGVDKDKITFAYRLLDKKGKITNEEMRRSLVTLLKEDKAKSLLEALYYGEGLLTMMNESSGAKYLNQVIDILRDRGVGNIQFIPTLTRGFDYYTGVVFEVFDTNEENPRSLFGGGRYDGLVGAYLGQSIPAFGFGMGDVTIKDFLVTHKLVPTIPSSTELYICLAPDTDPKEVYKIADMFRSKGVNTAVDISGRKLHDQLKSLDKRKVPFVSTVGTNEIQGGQFTVRNTSTREGRSGSLDEVSKFIKTSQQ
jgi:histidyl-tRNA synthetase